MGATIRKRLEGWVRGMVVCACAAVLLADSYPLLLGHGPPMLARDARALAIALVFTMYAGLVACFVALAHAIVRRFRRGARVALLAVLWLLAAGCVYVAMDALFLLAHLTCYAGLCRWSDLPDRLMYTLAASARNPASGILVAFAFGSGLAWWRGAARTSGMGAPVPAEQAVGHPAQIP
jgi:hypothetical protein